MSNMDDNMEDGQDGKGCAECCTKCVGGLPYASLFATVLLFMGVALFCGCGHEALAGSALIMESYFDLLRAPPATDDVTTTTVDVFMIIDILQYVIYGLGAGFLLYGVILLVEGFVTTGAIRELYGTFKISICGRCVSALFILISYLFFLLWLGVTAFSSVPVFIFYNIWSMCQNSTTLDAPNLCLDLRTYGLVSLSEEKKVCTGSEKFSKMCESNELDLTFHLFVCSLAGAGAAVIAMVHYLMVQAANWGYLKDSSGKQDEEMKNSEDQELHHLHSTRSKERLNAYT